jgi:hypothetical protein
MTTAIAVPSARRFAPHTLVALSTDPIELPAPGKDLTLSERLGPGIVVDTLLDNRVHVHWVVAAFEAWMDPVDLRVLSPTARLITICHCDSAGRRTHIRYRVGTPTGLEHHWTVELLPADVVRAVRDDGCAWTFNWLRLLDRIELVRTVGLLPTEDADAEARTAVEIALDLPGTLPRFNFGES